MHKKIPIFFCLRCNLLRYKAEITQSFRTLFSYDKTFQSLLDNANERILNGMIFRYLNDRGYYDQSSENQPIQTWSDEEEERGRTDGSGQGLRKSKTLAPSNILKIIN